MGFKVGEKAGVGHGAMDMVKAGREKRRGKKMGNDGAVVKDRAKPEMGWENENKRGQTQIQTQR